MIAENTWLEYRVGAEDWRVEDARGLAACFEMKLLEEVIEEWHGVFFGADQTTQQDKESRAEWTCWAVLCRRFGIHPTFGGDDPATMQACSMEVLEAETGLALASMEEWAVRHWKQRCAAAAERVEAEAEDAEMTEEEIGRLLRRYAFNVEDPKERAYIARRTVELGEVLDNDAQRALCRGMIQEEVFLEFVIDPPIKALRDRIKKLGALEEEFAKENKQLMDMMDQRGSISDRLAKTMAALGISERETSAKKKGRVLRDSLGGVVEAVRDYYAVESNQIIEGFRAAEIEVLTTPFLQRPMQYRPDLTAITIPAAIAGLFDPDFKLPRPPRKALRALMMGFRDGVNRARSEDGDGIDDLDEERAGDAAEEAMDEAGRSGKTAVGAMTGD